MTDKLNYAALLQAIQSKIDNYDLSVIAADLANAVLMASIDFPQDGLTGIGPKELGPGKTIELPEDCHTVQMVCLVQNGCWIDLSETKRIALTPEEVTDCCKKIEKPKGKKKKCSCINQEVICCGEIPAYRKKGNVLIFNNAIRDCDKIYVEFIEHSRKPCMSIDEFMYIQKYVTSRYFLSIGRRDLAEVEATDSQISKLLGQCR